MRRSWAKLPLSCTSTPGIRRSGSARLTVVRASWMAPSSTMLTAAGTASTGSSDRVAVITICSMSFSRGSSSACIALVHRHVIEMAIVESGANAAIAQS
jgi:hypothetical protein